MARNTAALPSLPEAAYTPLGSEVYRGLTASPKRLSPWLFYDAAGSVLFEAITELPEYYLTRTERSLLAAHAREMLAEASTPTPHGQERRLEMIELGAGTASKTGLLLRAAVERQGSVTYHAIDVSETALEEARQRIEQEIPGVAVRTRVADYTAGLVGVDAAGTRRLVLYIGSSIGNFEPDDARELLCDVRKQLAPGDMLLLGVDLVKDVATLVAAYDDAAGVTAAFNKNILERLNRELEANFDLDSFRHRVKWNGEQSRIEMHLESLRPQQVALSALDLTVSFRRGERIHTENSYKFTRERVSALLHQAGYSPVRCWTDEREWFGILLARVL